MGMLNILTRNAPGLDLEVTMHGTQAFIYVHENEFKEPVGNHLWTTIMFYILIKFSKLTPKLIAITLIIR